MIMEQNKEFKDEIEKFNYHVTEAFKSFGFCLGDACESLVNAFAEFQRLVDVDLSTIYKPKKPRLPRKLKKKYKKLGIYEQWKRENFK